MPVKTASSTSRSNAPAPKVTFTITRVPARPAQRKTLIRLMRLEPQIRRGLRRLALRRKRHDNQAHQRGGRMWMSRVRMTTLTHLSKGASFTITVTPQLKADLQSVEPFLASAPAH
jgi:hypothetical protein